MYIHVSLYVGVCSVPQQPEEVDRLPGAGVTGSCDQHDMGTELISSTRAVCTLNH